MNETIPMNPTSWTLLTGNAIWQKESNLIARLIYYQKLIHKTIPLLVWETCLNTYFANRLQRLRHHHHRSTKNFKEPILSILNAENQYASDPDSLIVLLGTSGNPLWLIILLETFCTLITVRSTMCAQWPAGCARALIT